MEHKHPLQQQHYIATKICQAGKIGYNGNLFGGTMLSWLDEAGAAFAGYICRTPNMVTLKMNEVLFKKPVLVGEHIRLYAQVEEVGTCSLSLRVIAQRFDFSKDVEEVVCSTNIVYVKVNEHGKAIPIDNKLREAMKKEHLSFQPPQIQHRVPLAVEE